MSQKEELAQELFGGEQQSKGALEAMKATILAIAPGLKNFGQDLKEELAYQAQAGAHELAAALFNGSAFVMYPRGGNDDHGVHGPEQAPDHGLGDQAQDMGRGGRGM